jgi:hypothetical protein
MSSVILLLVVVSGFQIEVLRPKNLLPADSMGPSEKTQHAIRRSTRLPLEVPVRVSSLDPSSPFSLECNTTLVNAHGCGLIVPRSLAQSVQVRLEIVSAKRYTTARVAEVVPLGGDPETWLVGLELEVPGNFWGIEYAPSDWKIEESSLTALVQQRVDKESITSGKPGPPRRWRLTDISAGACYLETPTPFPADTPVLLSIRALDTECLLNGVVRVSHAQLGMGVEFTEERLGERRAKVEELIGRLTARREVPKIFVGRKEKTIDGVGAASLQNDRSDMADVPSDVPSEDADPDPLLQLIRGGALLAVEQFLDDLRAQRLGNRRDPRIEIALPVLLNGTDVTGRPLDQRVMTVNISKRGALLEGVHGVLRMGDVISLTRLRKKEQFRVAWVGAEDTAAGHVGVAAVDHNTCFWDEVLEATARSGLEMASLRGSGAGTSPQPE